MATTTSRSASGDPRYILTPEQQALLFRVLESNSTANLDASIPSAKNNTSPESNTFNANDSSLLDYDYDFEGLGDQSLDFTYPAQDSMTGPILGTSSDGDGENHEKRSHPEEEDDDEDGGGKRREGDDKNPKKSGRKSLTNEPTSKRKAQNRAAQRAFRERKEKHLKDLETKVEDLQKASESANHENALLRAKMEQMESELKAYRNRSMSSSAVPTTLAAYPSGSFNNPNDVNFQFDFSQFGKLSNPLANNQDDNFKSIISPNHPSLKRDTSSGSGASPFDRFLPNNSQYGTFDDSAFTNNMGIIHDFDNNMSTFGPISHTTNEFGNAFPLQNIAANESQGRPTVSSTASQSTSNTARHQSTSNSTIYSSPSDSDHSATNNGPSSSCGTSPGPHSNSPNAKTNKQLSAADVAGTNNNPYTDQLQFSSGFTPGIDMNNFDWSLHNNANMSFDPQLFGDYREPQNAILAGQGLYDGSFFNEAIDLDQFGSPANAASTPQPVKKDLVSSIDEKLNADHDTPAGDGLAMTCNLMWERISKCPSVQNGDINMDDLCSQLTSKAKCSGDGPVINESDFKEVIRGLLPKDKSCPETS